MRGILSDLLTRLCRHLGGDWSVTLTADTEAMSLWTRRQLASSWQPDHVMGPAERAARSTVKWEA